MLGFFLFVRTMFISVRAVFIGMSTVVAMISAMRFMQHFHVFKLMAFTGNDAKRSQRQEKKSKFHRGAFLDQRGRVGNTGDGNFSLTAQPLSYNRRRSFMGAGTA